MLYFVASFAEWFNSHEEVLNYVMPIIVQALNHPSLAMPATLALKEVVKENQTHLQPFTPIILATSQVRLETRCTHTHTYIYMCVCIYI